VFLDETEDGSDHEGQAELEQEWAEVGKRTVEASKKKQAEAGKIQPADNSVTSPISYKEVKTWVDDQDLDMQLLAPFVQTVSDVKCGCMPMSRCMTDIPHLNKKHKQDKDRLLVLNFVHFDFNEVVHFRMLRTIYTKTTGNKTCSSTGGHWELLGFQNTDPKMDLNRSGGVLNVIHFFFFFCHVFDIFKSAWLLSRDEQQNFPLACISINITKMVVECLLNGQLSKVCNACNTGDGGMFAVVARLHSASVFHFCTRWRNLKRTIRDSSVTLKEVRTELEKRPEKLLKQLAEGMQAQSSKHDTTHLKFTDLELGTSQTGQQGAKGQSAQAKGAQAVPDRMKNYQEGSAA